MNASRSAISEAGAGTLPGADRGCGIGLRAAHYNDFLDRGARAHWVEVHTENVFNAAGRDTRVLDRVRRDHSVSLHGVGLGIGSARGFSERHLARVAEAVRRFQPALVSEHLCWGAVTDRHLNDLLPLTLTRQSMDLVCDRVDHIQETLGRSILLENVSTYLRFRADSMSESQFLAEVARRTGCGILLDINNLYVNQCNHGEDALAALEAIVPGSVGEIHLAGHLVAEDAMIDHHGAPVADAVWELYRHALRRFGPVPTLIEWDTELPALAVLIAEADKAAIAARESIVMVNAVHSEPLSAAQRSAPEFAPNHGRDSMASIPLEDMQQSFAAALFSLDDEAAALPLFSIEVETAAQGLARYRGNLTASWHKALSNAYPVLLQLVGDEFFEALARAYGRAHPSNDGDLNRFGAQFSSFLRDFPYVADYPCFPDMAALEWELHVLQSAGSPLSTMNGSSPGHAVAAAIAALSPEALADARLRLRPGCRPFASSYAVVTLWHAHQGATQTDFPDKTDCPEQALLVHSGDSVQVLPQSPAEYAFLQALNEGCTVGQGLDAALRADPAFDFGAALQCWLAHEVFSHPASTTNLSDGSDRFAQSAHPAKA